MGTMMRSARSRSVAVVPIRDSTRPFVSPIDWLNIEGAPPVSAYIKIQGWQIGSTDGVALWRPKPHAAFFELHGERLYSKLMKTANGNKQRKKLGQTRPL